MDLIFLLGAIVLPFPGDLPQRLPEPQLVVVVEKPDIRKAAKELPQPKGRVTPQLRAAVSRVTNWLNTSPESAGWKRYLLLERLQAQVTTGNVDISLVHEVVDKLKKDHPGLEEKPFRDFNNELDYWLAPGTRPTPVPFQYYTPRS